MKMINTSEEYNEEAIVFFNKKCHIFSLKKPIDIESIAYDYVKYNNDFRYKDRVDGDVLVSILVDFGYLQFIKKEKEIRFHSLTEKGLKLVEEQNRNL